MWHSFCLFVFLLLLPLIFIYLFFFFKQYQGTKSVGKMFPKWHTSVDISTKNTAESESEEKKKGQKLSDIKIQVDNESE